MKKASTKEKTTEKKATYTDRQDKTSAERAADAVLSKAASAKMKNIPTWLIITALVCLILSAALGAGIMAGVCKNDRFELVGDKSVTVALNSEYKEDGVKIVAYGKDVSDSVVVEGSVDTSAAGKYYIVYKSNNKRFSSYKIIRTVIVEEA